MFHKFLSDPHMILTFPQKIFYFKKCTHHTHFWIDVNCVFGKNIDIYLYFDTIDGFGYRGIERRCGKIPHMTYLSHDKVGIWIDSHVGIKWFPPYEFCYVKIWWNLIILTKTDFDFKKFTREHLDTLVTYPFFLWFGFFSEVSRIPPCVKNCFSPKFRHGLGAQCPNRIPWLKSIKNKR